MLPTCDLAREKWYFKFLFFLLRINVFITNNLLYRCREHKAHNCLCRKLFQQQNYTSTNMHKWNESVKLNLWNIARDCFVQYVLLTSFIFVCQQSQSCCVASCCVCHLFNSDWVKFGSPEGKEYHINTIPYKDDIVPHSPMSYYNLFQPTLMSHIMINWPEIYRYKRGPC